MQKDEINIKSEIKELVTQSGVNFYRCYQCEMCSNGCNLLSLMDFSPHQIVRLLQWGQIEEALESKTIWLCVGCYRCASTCPMGVDIPALMDELRYKALATGKISLPNMVTFHQAVLSTIYRYGRTHKLEIMLKYNLRQRNWFRDWSLGWRMLLKDKIELLPSKIGVRSEVRRIFGAHDL